MLNLFKSDRLAKACKAIESDNLEQLSKLLKKLGTDEINQPVSETLPTLTEFCILKLSAKALKLVLQHGGSPDQQSKNHPDLSLYELALQSENSLTLLTPLLENGQNHDCQALLKECFNQCASNQLMLHISLLLQHGAEITDDTVHSALSSGELPLINFLFNSGATLPEDINSRGYKEEIIRYAEKCVEDLKIRQMFLT